MNFMHNILTIIAIAISFYNITYAMNPQDMLEQGIQDKNFILIEKALEAGADINYQSRWKIICPPLQIDRPIGIGNPLNTAVETGSPEVVSLLLKRGAKVNAPIAEGETALHKAVIFATTSLFPSNREKYLAIVQLLLNHNADINSHVATPRNRPQNYNFPDNLLVDYGPCTGATPLHYAIGGLYMGSYTGANVLHYANYSLITGFKQDCDLVKLLLQNGANPNAPANNLDTPLHLAADINALMTIRILMGHGAYINTKNRHGETPLHKAIEKRRCSLAEENLIAPANYSTARLLSKYGADIGSKNNSGKTPLCLAAQWELTDIVGCLIAYDDAENWKKIDNQKTKQFIYQNHALITQQMLERYHKLKPKWNYVFYKAKCIGKDAQLSEQDIALAAEKIADLKVPKLAVVEKRLGIPHEKRFAEFYPKQPSKQPSLAGALDDVPNCTIC